MKFIANRAAGYFLLPVLLCGLLPVKGHAGVMIGGTRFIYNEESDNGLSFLVRNTDDTPYLIQTRVQPDDTKGNEQQLTATASELNSFVATPPLLPLRKKQENYIRIIHSGGKLPNDRESLFQLSVAVIPTGKPDGADVQVALRSRYKLIYRPSDLKGSPVEAYQQLRWQRTNASVTVENPTPYYVTLFQVSINGEMLPAEGVVAPFSSRTEHWCPRNGACQLQWQSLDDYGMPTDAWEITPQATLQTGLVKTVKLH